jgi:hypothetical protein
MNLDQISEKYGETKADRLFVSILNTPHHELAEEILELWGDDYIETLINSFKD